jgi:hypothetical protein
MAKASRLLLAFPNSACLSSRAIRNAFNSVFVIDHSPFLTLVNRDAVRPEQQATFSASLPNCASENIPNLRRQAETTPVEQSLSWTFLTFFPC